VLANGSVECWGPGGEEETDPSTNYGASPQTIPGVPPVPASGLVTSDGFSCVLTPAGGVECWGGNSKGELGNGTMTPSAMPVPVTGLASGVSALAANGGTTACAVLPGGHLKCWGSQPMSAIPVDVAGLTSGVASVSVGGEEYACALMSDTTVQCWGGGGSAPMPVGVTSAMYVSANELCSCALLTNQKIMCWGMTLPAIGGVGSCLGDGNPGSGSYSPPVEVQGF
jgi:hypothetical protein